MSMLYVLYVPNDEPNRIVSKKDLAAAKSMYSYNYTYQPEYFDETTYEMKRDKPRYMSKEDALKTAVRVESNQYNTTFTKDTWIVDEDGTVLAVIQTRQYITYHT